MSVAFWVEDIASIDSTNDACRMRAEAGEPEGLVIRADRQTAGRGRRGRDWDSPPGNLYASILLRPARSLSEAATLGFALVLALGNTVKPLLPPAVEIGHKWPNDLLLNRRKVAGLLLDAKSDAAGRLDWLVIGIGVNIVSHPENLPYPATDLAEMGAVTIAPSRLLALLLDGFSRLYTLWSEDGFAPIAPQWLDRAVGIGEVLEVRLEAQRFLGRFVALDSDGALVLELASGEVKRVYAGDVHFPTFPAPQGA